jgi:para-aminobenzoate synthetase component 1
VHLVSGVRGVLVDGCGWPELLDATFPPGSVTGAPKLAACAAISELEPVPRGPYCGALGWVDADAGVGDLNVAIRTFWLADGSLHFGTGGGITWSSDPSGEWEETVLKSRRLIAAVAQPW